MADLLEPGVSVVSQNPSFNDTAINVSDASSYSTSQCTFVDNTAGLGYGNHPTNTIMAVALRNMRHLAGS